MVVYPLADSCSTCSLSVAGWTERAVKADLDVVVVATKPNRELKELRKEYSISRVAIVTGVDEETIKRFSSGDKIGGVRISNGRIVTRQVGGSPPPSFFNPARRQVGKEVKL